MFDDWTSADWCSNIAGIVLFLLGLFLTRRQGQILEQIHGLSDSATRMQGCEKVGVINQRAAQVERGDETAAHTLHGDTISLLEVFDCCPAHDIGRQAKSVDRAISVLGERCDGEGCRFKSILLDYLRHRVTALRRKHLNAHVYALEALLAKHDGPVTV